MTDITVSASGAKRRKIYYPQKRPGFTAWVTAFDYQNGSVGISFKETIAEKNESYKAPKLEMGEAVGAPVSYCSVECGSENEKSYRVYMRSDDCGESFYETGRCRLEDGSFCNIGFQDGRIIGFDVSRINERRTGWCDYIAVRESCDGGSSWKEIRRLLKGTAPYLWRVRRLKDGTAVLLASFYGTPWGEGYERATRNTMLPGESYLAKIQTFFITTKDGIEFSEPHYVLSGTGAHEYDFVELNDGSLLFIAGDVQATPCARQIVTPSEDGYINGTIYGIEKGAPPNPKENPQGGYVPESIAVTEDGLIIGSRRNKPYSCSNDLGANWFEVNGPEKSLYQPFLMIMPDGKVANFGHCGGDSSFGQEDMWIGGDFFDISNDLPPSCRIELKREMSANNSRYINKYCGRLLSNGKPVSGERLTFRINMVWTEQGTLSMLSQEDAPIKITAVTDENGCAYADLSQFDKIPDIHFYYNIDVVCEGGGVLPCKGPIRCEAALTPKRKTKYPYEAYFAEGTLYLSPDFTAEFEDIANTIKKAAADGDFIEAGKIDGRAAERLLACGALKAENGGYTLYKSVHAPPKLADVLEMKNGDWYE